MLREIAFKITLPAVLLGGITLWIAWRGESLFGLLVCIALLTALGIHELAHIFMTRIFDYQVAELRFSPLGGSLKIDSLVSVTPEMECLIALAGPFANLLLVSGVSYLKILGIENGWLQLWYELNLLIGLINLLPALPLDGGRILQALLSRGKGLASAGVIVKISSLLVGVLLSGYGGFKLYQGDGGLLYLLTGILILVQIGQQQLITLDLARRLLHRKKKLLVERGLLRIRTLLVTPETRLSWALKQLGGQEYLLFYLQVDGVLYTISEELVWQTLLSKGYQMTFGELHNCSDKSLSKLKHQIAQD